MAQFKISVWLGGVPGWCWTNSGTSGANSLAKTNQHSCSFCNIFFFISSYISKAKISSTKDKPDNTIKHLEN